MLEFVWYSFLLSVVAYVFVNILADEGMILGWYDRLLMKINPYLAKPLGGCDYCFGGQLALFFYWWKYGVDIEGIMFICLTINFIIWQKRLLRRS